MLDWMHKQKEEKTERRTDLPKTANKIDIDTPTNQRKHI